MVVKDLVCQMTVDTAKAAATKEYNGTTYYFCSKGCAEQFARNPEQYVKAGGQAGHGSHHHGGC